MKKNEEEEDRNNNQPDTYNPAEIRRRRNEVGTQATQTETSLLFSNES